MYKKINNKYSLLACVSVFICHMIESIITIMSTGVHHSVPPPPSHLRSHGILLFHHDPVDCSHSFVLHFLFYYYYN